MAKLMYRTHPNCYILGKCRQMTPLCCMFFRQGPSFCAVQCHIKRYLNFWLQLLAAAAMQIILVAKSFQGDPVHQTEVMQVQFALLGWPLKLFESKAMGIGWWRIMGLLKLSMNLFQLRSFPAVADVNWQEDQRPSCVLHFSEFLH